MDGAMSHVYSNYHLGCNLKLVNLQEIRLQIVLTLYTGCLHF